MDSIVRGVEGSLLRWAREQQGLTMREIAQRCGIAIGYQSEVENGKKADIRSSRLAAWLECLNVTEAFARGEIPSYQKQPEACFGLAADVTPLLTFLRPQSSSESMSADQRVRMALQSISESSRRLPRVVLSYVLGVDVTTLDAMIGGELSTGGYIVRATADLLAVPETDLMDRVIVADSAGVFQALLPAITLALQAQVSTEELKEMILTRACNRALGLAVQVGNAVPTFPFPRDN